MIKKQKSVQDYINERNSLIQQREQVDIAMNAIVDEAKAKGRELSAEENTKYQQLQSDFNRLSREIAMNFDAVNMLNQTPKKEVSKNELMREAITNAKKEGQTEFVLSREINTVTTIDNGGLVPLTINDVVNPLEMGLIFDKVGVPVQTGVVGNLQWPVLGGVEAEIVGETVELADKTLDLTKINAKPVRIGISFSVSNQAINSSSVDLVRLIQDQARAGLARTLNRAMFSHENFTGDFHGPYANAKSVGTFAGAIPTYKELLAMKGAVAATGVQMIGFCYVMSEAMKATLEATPIDAGSGRMIVENGTIAGYPVFTTEFINYGSDKNKADVEYIAAGVYGYLAVNQYGEPRMVVDPYTMAKKDCVVVTLNTDWSMTTLRKEAFALWKTKTA